ncbi:MAG: hypothetical protein ABIM89_16700 [Mycobacteriales bacterium]
MVTSTAHAITRRVKRGLAARARRQRLAKELSSYRSDADRAELDAIISRHSAEEVREIERILSAQAARERGRTHPRR